MRISLLLLTVTAFLSGCDSGLDHLSDQELHERAIAMPLEQRYEFYLRVYQSTLPHRTSVAGDVAALGDPAWDYTMHRAISDGYYRGLHPALDVLAAFGRKCTASEYSRLTETARRVAPNASGFRNSVGSIRIACALAPGTTWQAAQEDLKKACATLRCN
jgi:hypothetical protein